MHFGAALCCRGEVRRVEMLDFGASLLGQEDNATYLPTTGAEAKSSGLIAPNYCVDICPWYMTDHSVGHGLAS